MANCVHPDQTVPQLSHLILVCTVCKCFCSKGVVELALASMIYVNKCVYLHVCKISVYLSVHVCIC